MCHSTAKAETIAIGTTSVRLAGPSIHRKRLIITVRQPLDTDKCTNNVFANPAVVSITITPNAGERIHLHGFSVNASAAYTGTFTIKNNGVTVGTVTVNYTAGNNDVQYFLPNEGIIGVAGQNITITGPAAGVGVTVAVNVIAHSHPEGDARITISPETTVTLDKGLTINAGIDPVILDTESMGDWLQRDLFVVADVATNISIVDVTEIGKRQGAPHYERYLDMGEMDKHNPKGY